MTLDDAIELISVLTDETKFVRQSMPRGRELSAREREVVTLVARGHTNAQIAAELFISVRTVISHLDRIRGKTGYRRRADLTRLARTEGLV
jgi:DNA-binding NarL/FixJ family response regulator